MWLSQKKLFCKPAIVILFNIVVLLSCILSSCMPYSIISFASFGAVFGAPIAGAVFALELLAIGRIKCDASSLCFIASMLADITCAAYGIQRTA
jgi:hypothetical protein